MKYKYDGGFIGIIIWFTGMVCLIGGTFTENYHSIIGGFLMIVCIQPFSVVHYQGRED